MGCQWRGQRAAYEGKQGSKGRKRPLEPLPSQRPSEVLASMVCDPLGQQVLQELCGWKQSSLCRHRQVPWQELTAPAGWPSRMHFSLSEPQTHIHSCADQISEPSRSPFLSWTGIFTMVNVWEMPFFYAVPLCLSFHASVHLKSTRLTFCRIYLWGWCLKSGWEYWMCPGGKQCLGALFINFAPEFAGRPGVLLWFNAEMRLSWHHL